MSSNDLFGDLGNFGGALGGLMGGLAKSGLVLQDTPEGKLLAIQSELADLQKQEAEILREIGRQAYQQNPSAWPQHTKLQLLQQNLVAAQETLSKVKQEKEQAEAAKLAEDAKGRCSNCGYKNAEGIKFCQDCGMSLATDPKRCTSCGAEIAFSTRFCGECGAKQEG